MMSSSIRRVSPSRVQFDGSISVGELGQLARDPEIRVLQCATPVPDSLWRPLDELFFAERPDVELRIFGHYAAVCDLGFARQLRHVRHFAADCLMQAQNVDAIAEIPRLESLSLGIFDAEAFKVLETMPPTLTSLSLGATKSRKPSLAPLERFGALQSLYLEGHSKGLDVLGRLPNLERLTLRSVTTRDLRFLEPLRRLWSLDLKLGRIESFAGIIGNANLKYLEIWQVREVHDLAVIEQLPGLQYLFLQSLPHVAELPPLTEALALRRIVLENLKGLADLSALRSAPVLEEFLLVNGQRQTPEHVLPVLKNPAVRRASAGFGNKRKNAEFDRLRLAHRKAPWHYTPFQFRFEPSPAYGAGRH